MSSFRERFGCDWLQYRNHLEASAPSTLSPDTLSPGPAPSPPPPEASPQEVAEEVRPELEVREEEELEEEGGEEHSEVEGECSEAAGEAEPGGGPDPGVRRAHVRGWPAALPSSRVPLSVSPQWSSAGPCWCVPWRGPRACRAGSAFSGSLRATCLRWSSKRLEPCNGLSFRVWRQLR